MKKTRSNHLILSAHTPIQRIAFWQVSLLISILLICSGVAMAQSTDRALSRNTLSSQQARERVRQVIPAVGLVLVRNSGNSEAELRPRGSAVVVRKDGLVATNFHVVARDKTQRIYEDIFLSFALEPGVAATATPRRYRLKPLLLNQERDLALLRILPEDGKELPSFHFIELGDAQSLELLDEIAIIGFPEKGGTTVTVNTGVVEGKDSLDAWIKTDARLIHGNSGGAAVNSEGKLIGIPTRVVVDSDGEKSYGAVGYLRPSYLVASMISKYQETESNTASVPDKPKVATMVAPAATDN
ncbi:MAG TPA: serine protease, partial [Blastocatellia bacterium]|nr:serine protease [Blastocatellia bacterium]